MIASRSLVGRPKLLPNNPQAARLTSPWLYTAAALLLATCSLHAQAAPDSSPSGQSVPTIKKTIRLVEVEVIAKDRKGRPVTDLQAKDFSLRDNGRVEKITFFSIQQAGEGAKQIIERSPEETPAPPRPTHVFSNSPSSAVPVVILMDLLNTSWDNQAAMKSALLSSVKRIPSQTPVALLVLGEELIVVSDFTTDSNALATILDKPSALRQEGSGPPITAPKTSSQTFNATILKTAVRAFNQETGDRAIRTIRALSLIRNQLGRMRGRKSLIWIGGGLSVPPLDWPVIRNVIDEFNNANVAVYTVDARGVLLDYGVGADIDELDLMGPWHEEQAVTRGDILEVMARSTGGVPYRNTNALDEAILRAVDDSITVYSLGYYPQHDDWQGKPHKIEVKAAREGVNLRYRSEYLATPQAQSEPVDQPQMLEAIAASPLDFPGLRFSVEAKLGDDLSTEILTLHVPVSELRLSLRNEKLIGALQLWFIQKQPSGDDLTRKTSTFTFELTSSQYEDAVAHSFDLTSVIKLKKTATKVRVLLHDINSGRVGTVDVSANPATIPEAAH